VEGLVGPLTYHFDQYKLIHQEPAALKITAVARPTLPPPPTLTEGQITVATFNVENYFDLVKDTSADNDTEPVPTAAELAIKRAKLAYAIGRLLGCPTLIGLQEVEKASLLHELADEAAAHCGFTYQVTHLESADVRGIDVAFLSDPRRVTVVAARLHQVCTALVTDIRDPAIQCPHGRQPLSSRPPLQMDVLVDGRPLALFTNHLKSKRGGEAASAPQREAQAELIRRIVQEMLAADPQAAVIVMGDFNDYFDSAPLRIMTGGATPLQNALAQVAEDERYSFIFGGASQLIDGLLLSPVLSTGLVTATIVHNSADFPYSLATDISPDGLAYRTSDHDIPLLLLQWVGERPLPDMVDPVAAVPWLWLLLALVGGMALGGIGVAAVLWRRSRPAI
jgi:predicted extracellular nuclease